MDARRIQKISSLGTQKLETEQAVHKNSNRKCTSSIVSWQEDAALWRILSLRNESILNCGEGSFLRKKKFFLAAALTAMMMGMSSLPAAVPSAEASVETMTAGNADMKYPYVHLKDDAAIEVKINADIRSQLDDMRYGLGYHYDQISTSYQCKYEGQRYVSLILCVWTYNHGAAHGMPHYRGVTYDKENGERASIRDFVKISSDDADRIYNLPVFSISGKLIPKYDLFSEYADTPLSGNFFLAGHGQIGLIYQPYQLAAFVYGMTSIILPTSLVEELNEKNP